MTSALFRKYPMLRNMLLASLVLTSTTTIVPDAAFAVPKGKLTKQQERDFKAQKQKFKAQKKAAKKAIRALNSPYKKAEKELTAATKSANNSRTNLNQLKSKLEDLRLADPANHALYGTGPYKKSDKLKAAETLYDRAEKFHQDGPKARFEAADKAFKPLNTQMTNARNELKSAKESLAIRKWEKGAAREANLAAAQVKKVANVQKKPPLKLAYVQLGSETLESFTFSNIQY